MGATSSERSRLMTVPSPAHYFTLRDCCVRLARLRPGQQGDDYDFTSDRYSDYLRRRRDLLLGHREVCPRWTTCKSSQAARGADLSCGHPSAGSATGGNWWTLAAESIVNIPVALLSQRRLSSRTLSRPGSRWVGLLMVRSGRAQAGAHIGVALGAGPRRSIGLPLPRDDTPPCAPASPAARLARRQPLIGG